MLPVVLALEQSEGFFGTQLRHAAKSRTPRRSRISARVSSPSPAQSGHSMVSEDGDRIRLLLGAKVGGELGLSGELIVRGPAFLADHSLVPKGDCPMRVSVTFPVLRWRTVM